MTEGWKCPVCGIVNAPWVAHCPCAGNPGYTTKSASTNKPFEQYDYTTVQKTKDYAPGQGEETQG